jgi:hypothetical protein
MTIEHRLVFSYDPDEIIPTFLGYGHGLKHENLAKCTSTISCKSDTFFVVKKLMEFKNKNIEMYLTFSLVNPKDEEEKEEKEEKEKEANVERTPSYGFTRGVLYVDKKSYNIKFYGQYNSLQIGEWCYDNIGVVRLESNIFAEFDQVVSVEGLS